MFCPSCGKPSVPGTRFCAQCGAVIAEPGLLSTTAAPSVAPALASPTVKRPMSVLVAILITVALLVICIAISMAMAGENHAEGAVGLMVLASAIWASQSDNRRTRWRLCSALDVEFNLFLMQPFFVRNAARPSRRRQQSLFRPLRLQPPPLRVFEL
jgi:hypothetical protein